MVDYLIPNYPKGSNITIMDIMYKRPEKDEIDPNKKWPDELIMIYKDNDTGIKGSYIIQKPEYTYYILKNEYQTQAKPEHYMDINKLKPVTCRYSDILKSIAEKTGNRDLYIDNMKTGNYRLNTKFFTHPRIYGADLDIRNYARINFSKNYQNPVCPINIMFFDIESDIINALSDEIRFGECPINAISAFYTLNKTMYTFLLRNEKNKQIEEFENDVTKNHKAFIDDFKYHINTYIGEDKIEKYGLKDTKLDIKFFDREEDLLIAFFDLLKTLNPDFVTAWNLFGYDLQQIMGRLEALELNTSEIMCDHRIKTNLCKLYLDHRTNEITDKTDRIDISAMYTMVDQEIIYASRRKNRKKPESLALDYIGELECGVKKYDYHEITTNIAKLPYANYRIFVLYNIIDVIVQACIEAQTNDIAFMFLNVIEMRTPYDKIYRQTVFLATKAYEFYLNNGVVMSNNINRFNKEITEKYPGAFVGSPKLLSNVSKDKSNSLSIMKFNNVNDFDYKSLYPSIIKWGNMSANTMIGMINIPNAKFKDSKDLEMTDGGTYIENLTSYNFIEFCHRWMGFANIDEILKDIEEYYTKYRTPIYKSLKGDKELDKNKKVIAYIKKPFIIDMPMSNELKEKIDIVRKSIVIK